MTGTGVGEYYLSLSAEDYYLEGGEPPGEWLGEGARSLGLTGEVTRETLRATLSGFSPLDGEALAQNAGKKSRHSGWDMTFSAPKSVSVLWALSDRDTRKRVEEAHKAAVATVVALLEEHGITTRRGRGGVSVERGKLVAASFFHGTSRALDPQIHSHVLVSNQCERADGTWGTVVGRELFKKKMALGALYRAELSRRLSAVFQVTWRKEGSLIELCEVKKELVSLFSKRRDAIEKLLKERNESGAVAAKLAALDSREVKKVTARARLYEAWAAEARTIGVEAVVVKPREEGEPTGKLKAIFDGVLTTLLERQSYFSLWEVIRRGAEASLGSGEGAESVVERAKTFLKTDEEVLHLGEDRTEPIYTTRTMWAAEEELLDLFGPNVSRELGSVAEVSALTLRHGLNREQGQALAHLGGGRDLSIVSGMAGTGKSRLLKAALELYSARELTVYGAALSGKAAEGLQQETGIQSGTIHRLLLDLRSGRVELTERSVVILDEAAMVGTLMLRELAVYVARARARLVLVGDERQIQPIAAGGPFQALKRKFGGVILQVIRRQRSAWDRERIMELVRGRSERAFSKYAEKGRLTVGDTAAGTLENLLSAWQGNGVRSPGENLILASENVRVTELNRRAQAIRERAGKLGATWIEHNGSRFYVGDRVIFTRNSKLIGCRNGSLGTVLEVQRRRGKLVVALDSGGTVRVRIAAFPHLSLGYAVTTHKAQGLTGENVFVLLGGSLQDRESTYVQASRARGDTRFFVAQAEAGENLRRIAFLAAESHQKKLALEVRSELRRRQ